MSQYYLKVQTKQRQSVQIETSSGSIDKQTVSSLWG